MKYLYQNIQIAYLRILFTQRQKSAQESDPISVFISVSDVRYTKKNEKSVLVGKPNVVIERI